ncbi:hypothetical protein [Pseudomonas phage vB_Pae_CF23a]|nr:hypothetical protein [Pseudomonas phage vB_Pae_CF23a]QBI80113.1 hypothetical protein [Pseudomonas phage vB_Pae_CF65a]QBI80902.1 hypothetical protein [Pseudomonas phage vB_Pae_BR243a]
MPAAALEFSSKDLRRPSVSICAVNCPCAPRLLTSAPVLPAAAPISSITDGTALEIVSHWSAETLPVLIALENWLIAASAASALVALVTNAYDSESITSSADVVSYPRAFRPAEVRM